MNEQTNGTTEQTTTGKAKEAFAKGKDQAQGFIGRHSGKFGMLLGAAMVLGGQAAYTAVQARRQQSTV
jgi:hypothetical protein